MGKKLVSVMEHTEWVKPVKFLKMIASFASHKEETAKKATQYVNSSDKVSFETDISRLDTERTRKRVV